MAKNTTSDKLSLPTSSQQVIINNIGKAIRNKRSEYSTGVTPSEDLITNSNLNISYTIRSTFPGSNGSGKHSDITNGGQTHASVQNCLNTYFGNDDKKIKAFSRYYYSSPSTSCVNDYVTGGCGIYPVNGPSGRKDYVGNCTAYVYGRSLEIIEEGIGKNIPNDHIDAFMPQGTAAGGNAFWNAAVSKKQLRQKGNKDYYWTLASGKDVKPEHLLPGTIICYNGDHVAVVEKVSGNNVYISQSSFSTNGCKESGGYGFIFDYFSTNWSGGNNKLGSGSLNKSGYTVAGFIIPDWNKIKSDYGSK